MFFRIKRKLTWQVVELSSCVSCGAIVHSISRFVARVGMLESSPEIALPVK